MDMYCSYGMKLSPLLIKLFKFLIAKISINLLMLLLSLWSSTVLFRRACLSAGLIHKELQKYTLQDKEFYHRYCILVCMLGSLRFPFFSTWTVEERCSWGLSPSSFLIQRSKTLKCIFRSIYPCWLLTGQTFVMHVFLKLGLLSYLHLEYVWELSFTQASYV